MSVIERLSELFARFPGIGQRQARRFVYFLLKAENGYVKELLESVAALKKNSARCPQCFRFFETGGNKKICAFCADPLADHSLLMVVEKDSDIEPARAGGFAGRFFVLGGMAQFGTEEALKKTRLNELLAKAERETGLREIILAFAANPAGEGTDQVLREALMPTVRKHNLKISSLGRGLSTGAELEYADPDTLKNALKNRQ